MLGRDVGDNEDSGGVFAGAGGEGESVDCFVAWSPSIVSCEGLEIAFNPGVFSWTESWVPPAAALDDRAGC